MAYSEGDEGIELDLLRDAYNGIADGQHVRCVSWVTEVCEGSVLSTSPICGGSACACSQCCTYVRSRLVYSFSSYTCGCTVTAGAHGVR